MESPVKSRWNGRDASQFRGDLRQHVSSSRLLGPEPTFPKGSTAVRVRAREIEASEGFQTQRGLLSLELRTGISRRAISSGCSKHASPALVFVEKDFWSARGMSPAERMHTVATGLIPSMRTTVSAAKPSSCATTRRRYRYRMTRRRPAPRDRRSPTR
jgi:hypothetical protein